MSDFGIFSLEKMDFLARKNGDIFEKWVHFLILWIVFKNETSLPSEGPSPPGPPALAPSEPFPFDSPPPEPKSWSRQCSRTHISYLSICALLYYPILLVVFFLLFPRFPLKTSQPWILFWVLMLILAYLVLQFQNNNFSSWIFFYLWKCINVTVSDFTSQLLKLVYGCECTDGWICIALNGLTYAIKFFDSFRFHETAAVHIHKEIEIIRECYPGYRTHDCLFIPFHLQYSMISPK